MVVRSSTTPARRLHELNTQNRHIHLIEIKYYKDTWPGAQLEASQQEHSELCKQLQGAEITIHTILLGVGGTIYTAISLQAIGPIGPVEKTRVDPKRGPLQHAGLIQAISSSSHYALRSRNSPTQRTSAIPGIKEHSLCPADTDNQLPTNLPALLLHPRRQCATLRTVARGLPVNENNMIIYGHPHQGGS
eukprot:1161701-Pelagomonas_calceolata.AAC.2